MKFKVGDKVRIKSIVGQYNEDWNYRYGDGKKTGNIDLVHDLSHHCFVCGKKHGPTAIINDHNFTFCEIENFSIKINKLLKI